jgi:hypothetical protein
MELHSQDRMVIAKEFGLPADGWRVLSRRLSNTLYLVDDKSPTVVRASLGRFPLEAEAEGWFATTLRENGFAATLVYRKTRQGTWACGIDQGSAVAYHYRSGDVSQPLSDSRFWNLIRSLPAYFAAKRRIRRVPQFVGSFPSANVALDEFRRIGSVVEMPKALRPYLDSDVPNLWQARSVIHGDLHAGNMLWNDDVLDSLLDFERCSRADEVVEVAALTTGTCFRDSVPDLDRLAAVLHATRSYLNGVAPPLFRDALIIMALYFFGRVNRLFPSAIHRLEWRDANRALAILRYSEEIESRFANIATG